MALLRTTPRNYFDALNSTNIDPGFGDATGSHSSGGVEDFSSGGGGDFAGGGATGSFDRSGSNSVADSAFASDVEVGDFAIPIYLFVLAVGLAIASLYVVYIAPELFAELLLDGALSYSLYRRLAGGMRGRWLSTAVRRTLLPFGLTAVFLGAVGAAMAHYAPEARSVGQVVHHLAGRE